MKRIEKKSKDFKTKPKSTW